MNYFLPELRERWEAADSEVVLHRHMKEWALSITQDPESKKYTCLRYFRMNKGLPSETWAVSQDHSQVTAKEAFQWLAYLIK